MSESSNNSQQDKATVKSAEAFQKSSSQKAESSGLATDHSDSAGVFQRLSIFYFLYFSVLGAFVPFRSRYFDMQGFDSFTIGVSASLLGVMTIVAPYFWANLAERFETKNNVLIAGVVLSAVFVFSSLQATSVWMLLISMAIYAACWNAILPQTETLTLALTSQGKGDYSRIRLWGSMGYMALVVSVGYGVEWFGVWIIQPVIMVFMALLMIAVIRIPRVSNDHAGRAHREPLRQHFWQRPVLIFMSAAVLVTVSHSPYYTFFDLYMRQLGYSASASGWLVTLGVLAEIGIFMLANRIIQRWRFAIILQMALIVSAVRWVLLATLAESLWVLLIVQLFHAVSFGLMHSLAMHFVHNKFPDSQRGRAQGIYTALTYGVGGAIGNVLAGHLWQDGVGSSATFMMSGMACVIAFSLVYTLWRRGDSAAPVEMHMK